MRQSICMRQSTRMRVIASGCGILRRVALAAVLACLSACIGPRYVRPSAPLAQAYKESSAPAYRGAAPGTWQPAHPADDRLKGAWWRMFKEPELDALEQQLGINNQNIAEYFQDFMAARAQIREAAASYFPTLSISPAYTRSREPSALAGLQAAGGSGVAGAGGTGSSGAGASTVSTVSIVSLPLDVSWEPDLWGRVRDEVREYRYAAQVSAADLQNERLTEQADLAEYYFELRGQDALQDLYNRTVAADRQALQLTQGLYQSGLDTEQDVAQARVALANAEAAAVGIAVNRAVYEHAIATLIGRSASSFSMPVRDLSTPVPAIPVGVPSELLQRRPDVAAAERTMAQANALIGVETTAFFPTLDLTGSTGFESTAFSTLVSAPTWFWSLGASASEAIFEGGLRRATLAQYRALFEADVAAYRQTVLTAAQQVEDEIASLRILSAQSARQDIAVQAAQQYYDIALGLYQTGVDPYLDVLTAQTTLLADQQTALSDRVSELMAAVELIQALGGGWDTSQLPAAAAVDSAAAARQLAPASSSVTLTGQ